MKYIPITIMSEVIYDEQMEEIINKMKKIPFISDDGYCVSVSEYRMICYATLNNLSSN